VKKFIVGFILIVIPIVSMGRTNEEMDKELNDYYYQQVLVFVKENPVIDKNVDVLGLVDMWQRIDGLSTMINLFHNDESYFLMSGKYTPRQFDIHNRINSHAQYGTIYYKDDPDVEILKSMVRMHWSFAISVMDGKVSFATYNEVTSFIKSSGRYIAERIEAKYGNGKTVLKPIPELEW